MNIQNISHEYTIGSKYGSARNYILSLQRSTDSSILLLINSQLQIVRQILSILDIFQRRI